MNVFCFIKDLLTKSKVTTFPRIDDQNNLRSSSQSNKRVFNWTSRHKTILEGRRAVLSNTFKSDHFTNMSVKLKTP